MSKRNSTQAAQWYPPLERDGEPTLHSGDRQTIEVTCAQRVRGNWLHDWSAGGQPQGAEGGEG